MKSFIFVQNFWIKFLHHFRLLSASIFMHWEHCSVYEPILAEKNFGYICSVLEGWNLCIRVCIGCNRGGASPFQVKFTKISYLRSSFQYIPLFAKIKRKTIDKIWKYKKISYLRASPFSIHHLSISLPNMPYPIFSLC